MSEGCIVVVGLLWCLRRRCGDGVLVVLGTWDGDGAMMWAAAGKVAGVVEVGWGLYGVVAGRFGIADG